MKQYADKIAGRAHAAVIPVHDQDDNEAEPEDSVAPARADGSDRAVALVFYDVAGTAAEPYADRREEEQKHDEKRMKVMVSRAGVDQKVGIECDDDYDAHKLRP